MRNKFFKMVLRRGLVGCVAFLFVLLAASLSWASTITYQITGINFKDLTATVIMEYDGTDTLKFTISNTTGETSYITGFAFNLPVSDVVTGLSPVVPPDESYGGFTAFNLGPPVTDVEGPPTPDLWGPSFDKNIIDGTFGLEGINPPGPVGLFDVSAITGKSINGGNIANAILDGETFEFTFTFIGNLIGLTTGAFNTFSFEDKNNDVGQILALRFQGFGDEDESDIGIVSAVPIPSAILLLGSGLLSLVGIRKKFIS